MRPILALPAAVRARLVAQEEESASEETKSWEWACAEQEEFFRRGPAPLLASGGFNSGKTVVALLKFLKICDEYPGYRVAVARRFASELKQTTYQTFLKLCPPEAIASKNEGGGIFVVELKNGSRFIFLHLGRPDATSIIMGLEVNGALLDQAEEMHEEVYDKLESRLGRWDRAEVSAATLERFEAEHPGEQWPHRYADGRPAPPAYMLLTANPDIETHWLWRRFHPESQEFRDQWSKRGYHMITFDSRRNRFASEANLDILLSKDDAFQARYVRGEWGNAEGVLFRVSDLSVLEPDEALFNRFREQCRLYRVLDHGDSAPTCCLWMAVDGEGNCYFFREYYCVADVRDHRKAIYELSLSDRSHADKDFPHYAANYADPSIFNKVPARVGGRLLPRRWSVAEEYLDRVVYSAEDAINWSPADNAEMVSRERIRDYLRVDPERLHPVTRERGAPRLYFVKQTPDYPSGCFHALAEVRSARRVQVGSENGRPVFGDERDERIPDHSLDCVRYALLSRPAAPRVQKPRAPGQHMTWDEYDRYRKDQRRYETAVAAASK